jgi:hypothetical protein
MVFHVYNLELVHCFSGRKSVKNSVYGSSIESELDIYPFPICFDLLSLIFYYYDPRLYNSFIVTLVFLLIFLIISLLDLILPMMLTDLLVCM